MRFDDSEHIVQIILNMITACLFGGHFQILSVL